MNLLINYDRNILDKIYIADVSPYPVDGVGIADVKQTRFKFATYKSVANAGQATSIKAGYEYSLVGTGSIVVNGRTLSAGDTFVLMGDYTPTIPNGLTLETTGYYVPYTSYLPTGSDAEFTPTQTGEDGDLYFADAVRFITYEIYDTEYATGTVNVSTTTSFIVKGTENDTITVGSGTFYVGETFTKSSNFTFAQGGGNIGTCTVVKKANEVEVYTFTDKYAYQIYEDYVSTVADGRFEKTNLIGNYLKVYSLLNTLYLGAESEWNVDLSNMQEALDLINDYYSVSKKF